jgi:adenylate kinase
VCNSHPRLEKMKLALFGPPGSGKGTYAKMLGETFKVDVISIGDILREEVENKSEIGVKVDKLMKKGELVSDDIILKIVENRIYGKEEIIFDGFPRSMGQINVDVDRAVGIVCSDEVCIKRITNRLTCSKCGEIYNVLTVPPKKKGVCDVCGGKLVSRSDKKVVKDRLRVFKRETLPVINYYKKEKILVNVNGERPVDEVYKDIRKLFKPKE